MLMGAFFAVWGSDVTGSWALAILIALAAGAAMGLLHAVFSISLRSDQIVGGTAINFLALGLSSYLFFKLYGSQGTPSDLSTIPDVHLGLLGHGFVGDVFGSLNLMIWNGIVVVFLTWIVVFKTPIGLRINAVAPGMTETPMTANMLKLDAMREGAGRQYPLGGVQTAAQVADTIAWLLSDGAARITGQVIAVDGGFTTVRPLVK